MKTSPPAIPPARVLVVDDEPQIRRFLDISLRSQGYQVATAVDGASGLAALAAHGADLVILDLGLPDRTGHEVLTDLREWSSVPVILLTVRADDAEKVRGFDEGANDYVTKPFSTPELLARVRALLRPRGSSAESPPLFDDGVLRVDLARRQVSVAGEPVVLARKEYALLSMLVRHAGRVVTQPQMLREIWGPNHAEDIHYLRILVGKLRQKLGDDATSPRWIVTEPGVGLRLREDEQEASSSSL